MRIALYGKSEGQLEGVKKSILECLKERDKDVTIDFYAEEKALKENLLQYDIVSLTEKFMDLLECKPSKMVTFAWGKKIKNCYVNDIYYAEAELKNVHIRFLDGEILVHLPFTKVEQLLAGEDFIKIHRSYLVNCCYIQSLDEHTVRLKNGVELPVSKYRSDEVREKYLEYLKKL